jgi:flagellar motor component MotA
VSYLFEKNLNSYFELLGTLFLLINKIRREGCLSIDDDINNPSESPIFNTFTEYEKLDQAVYIFICDVLRLIANGFYDPYPIERYMDAFIDKSELDEFQASLFKCARLSIISHLDGCGAHFCVEFGRQGVLAKHKTSYQELDNFILKLNIETAPTRESVNAMVDNIFAMPVEGDKNTHA